MTQEKVLELQGLYPEFKSECERVGKIIAKVINNIYSDYPDYEYAGECTRWVIEGDKVYGCGYDYCGDYIGCEFPIHYLTMSDEALQHMVSCINDEICEKRKQAEQKKKDAVRKRELSELKRLQEKYKDEL